MLFTDRISRQAPQLQPIGTGLSAIKRNIHKSLGREDHHLWLFPKLTALIWCSGKSFFHLGKSNTDILHGRDMGVDDEILDSEVLALSDDETSASRHTPARRPAIWNITWESDLELENNEDMASKGMTEGSTGETGADFVGARDFQTRSNSYNGTETGKSCLCLWIVFYSPFRQSLPLQCSIVLPTMQTCLTQMTQLFQPSSYKRLGYLQMS